MMKRVWTTLILFVAAAPLAALPEPTAEEVQANRRRFEQLRKQPEQVDKLRADAKAFFALSKERRAQIAQIHHALHKESSATQARLHGVLDRYVEWLEELDEATRQNLVEAPDRNARLALIKQVREDAWIADQPLALRDQIAKLQGDARQAFIAREKAEERQRRIEWIMAARFWTELEGAKRRALPTRLAELPLEVKSYVDGYLFRMFFSAEEKEQLTKLEGQWPQFPMKLVELADKHPPALPGPLGPKSFAELPTRVFANKEFLRELAPRFFKEKFQSGQLAKVLRVPEGKWPEFGTELARVARGKNHAFEHEFLAYNYACLSKEMKEFMTTKLEPLLDQKETLKLNKALDKWPDFPQTIQGLANRHQLHVPWFTLPREGNSESYRLQRTH